MLYSSHQRRLLLTPFRFLSKTVPSPLVVCRIALLLLSVFSLCAELSPGLALKFEQDGHADRLVVPYPSLNVAPNEKPALFLKPGPFTAEFSGFISIDLRAQHTFTAQVIGSIDLQVNGKEVLKAESQTEAAFTSKPIRLNKGTNALVVRYSAPTNGTSILRLLWSSRNSAVPIPIAASALSHTPDSDLARSLSIHNGAFLFEQYQCARCHAPSQLNNSMWDAPAFDGIGSRLRSEWITEKILNPSGERSSRMPALLHANNRREQADSIAAFLATLTSESQALNASPASHEAGATLINELHCRSCHTMPGEPASTDRISLKHVSKKFFPDALVAYLRDPQARFPGNPMPDFKLSATEAASIAAFLLPGTYVEKSTVSGDAVAGKALVQKSGCLNCHALDLPNQFTAPTLSEPFASVAPRGCLSTNSITAPRFAFSETDRTDLHAFISSAKTAPSRGIPTSEFAVQATTAFQCSQCHADAGLPAPLSLGGKLNPDWSARLMGGELSEKPRPWLKARMPAFPAYATNIAMGLTKLHGFSAARSPAPDPNLDLISIGEKLISANGGFSCVACHAVGSNNLQLVVESPGVNLAYSADRLLPDYFHRWLMNPLAIDPSTKMPAYFDAEGRSQLHEFFDGDAAKQIEAMWQYIHSLRTTK